MYALIRLSTALFSIFVLGSIQSIVKNLEFNRLNIILGWVLTLLAAVVYSITMEDTVSFWDCGEFIASAYKLLVGHPPGAPFFALLGRVFIIFGGDNPGNAAVMVNYLSVVSSALTIGFLFWTISALCIKMFKTMDGATSVAWTQERIVLTLGSAAIGALAYTFSDTFWFSAVEGEVYALSSLFTAVVFWAILKWDADVDKGVVVADRWILLIAYLMGLSIGVHLLNLLTIPAIGLIYYYKRYPRKKYGDLIAIGVSLVVLLFIQYGIIPGTIKIAAGFERLFANSLNMNFGMGFFFFLLAVAGGLAYGIYRTNKLGKQILNLGLWSIAVVVIGYSSYSIIFIRSMANTTMDENNPENVYSMISYLNRDQYGDRPLFYGQYFDARVVEIEEGKPIRMKAYVVRDEKGKQVSVFGLEHDANTFIEQSGSGFTIDHEYVEVDKKPKYVYEDSRQTVFPRMYSPSAHHVNAYREWTGLSPNAKPGSRENLKFFASYQVQWMYFRYFFWNFVGRENDFQGNGEMGNGHWISGIPFIDEMVSGIPQEDLPARYSENPARNTYYFLPLLLGLIGLAFQIYRDPKGALVVGMLFFTTGLAIVIYLNQTPYQPRERDYAYAGSFYAFCIWIGMGVLGLAYLLKNYANQKGLAAASLATLISISVPTILGFQNWDDHDRSERYTGRDFAWNYLNSCKKNAVLFTNGDNDTFPLWYLQEVQEERTDVRIVNLSLLNTDWYITQMKRKAYDGDPVPFSLEEPEYRASTRDQVLMDQNNETYYTVQEHMQWLRRTDGANQTNAGGNNLYFLRSNKFILPVDSAKVVETGLATPQQMANAPKELRWEVKKSYLLKNEVMILDLLANFNWERPIYFAVTVGNDNYMGLEKFFSLEGLAYRLVPFEVNPHDGQTGAVNSEETYQNFVHKFKWGNLNGESVYLDETNMRMVYNMRSSFVRLASLLVQEGKKDKAIESLDKVSELLPDDVVPYDYFNLLIADVYRQAGAYDKAKEVLRITIERYTLEKEYFDKVPNPDTEFEREKYKANAIVEQGNRLLQQIQMEEQTSPQPMNPDFIP